jgi:hypothetical protein
MNVSKRKDITPEIPVTKKLSRGVRKRRNKRLKWERIEDGASCEPNDVPAESNIFFNPLKVYNITFFSL